MKHLLTIALLLALPASAAAWTHAGDQRIAKKGADLAPPDLRLLLDHNAGAYAAGLAAAEADEGAPTHHYYLATREGRLEERIESETNAAIAGLRNRESTAAVVQRLGVLAHLVADANNPFHIANSDPRLEASHVDFEQYFERRLGNFPTVFYGLQESFALAPYLGRTFARTARFYPLMSEEYFRGGTRHTSADFDDRSTAFGVAAVCYSHAVTDLVNLYYFIWKEAGGDVRSAAVMRRGNLLLNTN
jgi:hypothetical protein